MDILKKKQKKLQLEFEVLKNVDWDNINPFEEYLCVLKVRLIVPGSARSKVLISEFLSCGSRLNQSIELHKIVNEKLNVLRLFDLQEYTQKIVFGLMDNLGVEIAGAF